MGELELQGVEYWSYGGGSILLALIVVYFLYKKCFKSKNPKIAILIAFFIVWVVGAIIYGIGFYLEGGTKSSLLALILRPMISSAGMFVSHSDLIEVYKCLKEDWVYMTFFSFTHFVAIFLTMLTVIELLGSRLKHVIRFFWDSRKKDKLDALYLFFGVNEASIVTAKAVSESETGNYRIIFIEFPEEKRGNHINFLNLIGIFSIKKSKMEKISGLGEKVYLCSGDISLSEMDSMDPRKLQEVETHLKNPDFSIFSKMGLSRLIQFIQKSTKVKVFFLSDDLQDNLNSFEVFCSDPYILKSEKLHEKVGNGCPKIIIYCQARRNNQNLVCEKRFIDVPRVEVHIIDKSYLSVYYLKTNLRYNPVCYVDAKDGLVTSDFNSMIIGFGETGQDVLEFLYEYGSFAGAQGGKGKFHCLVADKKMNDIEGKLYNDKPGLRLHQDEIELTSLSHGTTAFWDRLKQDIKTLNYIVITIGNDEMALSLAVDIYQLARVERNNDLRNFNIFVHVYDHSHENEMNRVASFYNENNSGFARKIFPGFKDDQIENKEGLDGTIVVFGELDEIYKLNYLYNEDEMEKASHLNKAKEFYNAYASLQPGDKVSWEERRRIVLAKEELPRLIRFQELRRKEQMDLECSLHVDTKLYLMGLIPEHPFLSSQDLGRLSELKAKYELYIQILEKLMHGEKIEDSYDIHLCKMVYAVAKTEHLRWNSAHEWLGYKPSASDSLLCDEIKKIHGCIKVWEELPDSYRYYDFQIVLTSLKVKLKELNKVLDDILKE